MKIYLCPSRRQGLVPSNWRLLKNDYAAVVPTHPLTATMTPESVFWTGDGRTQGVIQRLGPSAQTGSLGLKTRLASVPDGTSNTMMLGEKFYPAQSYTVQWSGDDKGALHGFDDNTFRSTVQNPAYFPGNPIRDFRTVTNDGNPCTPPCDTWHAKFVFGSAHGSGINAVFADGHVQTISYGVNALTFAALGGINDGVIVDLP